MTNPSTEPEKRYAHEIAPCPNGAEYEQEWRHATDLPLRMARYHAARAWGFMQASVQPFSGLPAEECVSRLLPALELAWVWAAINAAESRDRCPEWPVDLARDVLVDAGHPEVAWRHLYKLLGTLGLNPAEIRAYDLPAQVAP